MNLYFLAEITFDLSEEQPVCIIRQSVFNKLFHVCGVQSGSTESCVLAILDTVTSCVLCWGIQMWHSLSSVATVLIYCISECFIQQLTTLAANGLPPCSEPPNYYQTQILEATPTILHGRDLPVKGWATGR